MVKCTPIGILLGTFMDTLSVLMAKTNKLDIWAKGSSHVYHVPFSIRIRNPTLNTSVDTLTTSKNKIKGKGLFPTQSLGHSQTYTHRR